MGENKSINTGRVTVVVAICLVVAMGLPAIALAVGQGASSPEKAVAEFYLSLEEGNWDGYLSSILPDNVRSMTQEDVIREKESFESSDFTYEDLEFKTVRNPENEDKAEVELTAGKIAGTNPMTGEEETTTIKEIKEEYDITPKLETARYKGSWYVDVPLAAADQPQQQY